MTEEDIKAIAKQQADAIIKREKNLEKWFKAADTEAAKRRFSLNKEEALIEQLAKEADEITEKLNFRQLSENTQPFHSAKLRLQYIAEKTHKHKEDLVRLNIKLEVIVIIAKELVARQKAYKAALQAQIERMESEYQKLEMEEQQQNKIQ